MSVREAEATEEEEEVRSANSLSVEEEDEYHEDGLPDLIQETPEFRSSSAAVGAAATSSQNSSPSSSIDLLHTISTPDIGSGSSQHNHRSNSKSLTTLVEEGDQYYNEADYLPNGGASGEAILTEVSQSRRGVFKVHYLDHSKHYVSPAAAATAVDSEQLRYRSYLSLMPEDVDEIDEGRESRGASKEKILSDFRALSYEDQLGQREEWAKELDQTVEEIQEIKEKLALKTAWCGVLRRNLGISRWRRLGDACAKGAKNAKAEIQDAFEEIEVKSLKKAKDSFEQLSNEVRDRVRQGREEITKRMSVISVLSEEDGEGDENSNKKKSNESLSANADDKQQPKGQLKSFFENEDSD